MIFSAISLIQNIFVSVSIILTVFWSRQMCKHLKSAPKRQSSPIRESNTTETATKKVHDAPPLPKIDAPAQKSTLTRKPAPKRKTKRSRVAKKQNVAPITSMTENRSDVEVQIIVPVDQCQYSSEEELQPVSLEVYTSTSCSSDDEVGTSIPEVGDAGYSSMPSGSDSTSSQLSSSDEEAEICYPVVINGTTFYSTPKNNSYSHIITESQIYRFISSYLTASMKELKENGYPFFKTTLSKTATINPTQYTLGKKLWLEKEDKLRICCGCEKEFDLEKNLKKNQGVCQFHPKGQRFDKVRCCFIRNCYEQDDGFSAGCQTRPIHVFNQMFRSELDNFIQTEKPTGSEDPRSNKIYAIDCEMVYTMAGPALARLSVVDYDGNSVLDVRVKPPTRVIDANTEFSGLTMKEVNAAKDTLGTCRRKLLKLVNSETILVGHSLESDLKALRLVHYKVADTSLIYKPGKNKIGLKALALDYLGLQIQSNNKEQFGHDSEEDARVCLELLKLRVDNFVL